MIRHTDLDDRTLRQWLREGAIRLAGNSRFKIYGTLHCASGKRMNRDNRVFFTDTEEALVMGYRPCGHCCRKDYALWRLG